MTATRLTAHANDLGPVSLPPGIGARRETVAPVDRLSGRESDASDVAFESSLIARAQRQADESRRRGDELARCVSGFLREDDGTERLLSIAELRAALAAYEAPASAALAAAGITRAHVIQAEAIAFLERSDVTSSSCHGEAIVLLRKLAEVVL